MRGRKSNIHEMRRRGLVVLAAITAVAVLASCGSSHTVTTTSAGAAPKTTNAGAAPKTGLKIAVFSPFPRNDFSITQATIEGVQDAMKTLPGSKLTIIDNVSSAQQVPSIRDAGQTNDIIVLASGSLATATDTVASEFPHVWFIQYDATTAHFHPNVTSVDPEVGESAIITGAVAATDSSSKKLGEVTGLQLTGELEEIAGLSQGAKMVAPSATVAATFTGDYNDIGKAQQATKAQMANGVDGILGDLGLGFTGFYRAMQGSNVAAYDYQTFTSLGCSSSANLVGGVLANFRVITRASVEEAAAHKLDAGAIFIGLNNSQFMSFGFCPGKGTAAARKVAAETRAGLLSGKIKPISKALIPNPGYAVGYE